MKKFVTEGGKLIRRSIEELIKAWRPRYQRKEKTKILDESIALIGYHHKAAIRAFRRKPRTKDRRGLPRVCPNEVKAARLALWKLSVTLFQATRSVSL